MASISPPLPTATATATSSRLRHSASSPLIPVFSNSTSSARLVFHTPKQLKQRKLRFASAHLETSGGKAPVNSEDLASALEGVEVIDLTGKSIPILDLWSNRKAVVGFARHFGCVLCRRRADILASKKDAMDASGAALVIIGPGSVDQAKAFSAQTKFEGEVYADPNHSSFDALNFVSGAATIFTPAAGLKMVQSYMEGYRQDWRLSFEKDTVARGSWQQGGILVAGPGTSNILYLHKDKEAGDDPDTEEVLKACCS